MTKTAVVALGGNALTLPGQAGRCGEMPARTLAGTGAARGTRIEPSVSRAGYGR